MRHLYSVPIIHTQADLGSLAPMLMPSAAEPSASESWVEKQRIIEAKWARIRADLLALPIEWAKMRIYQDGLPIYGDALAIAKDVASKGSLNHRLLLELVERGATLMGTEDPALLIRDYERMKRLVKLASAPIDPRVLAEVKRDGDEILRLRDAFIAERILSTLEVGETGLLLIGLLHRVDELFSGRDICLHRLGPNVSNDMNQRPNSEATDV